jgi:uncharacterized FlaG/YvyC family protein
MNLEVDDMDKIVQKINWDMAGSYKIEVYMYGEASVEANQEMQEPLEKLYRYENQPDMREKIKEYVSELDMAIERLEDSLKITYSEMCTVVAIKSRLQTIIEVKNDLLGMLEEQL